MKNSTTQQKETLVDVCLDMHEHITDLGLNKDERALSRARTQCTDLCKGTGEDAYHVTLPEALRKGNAMANEYADRLVQTIEWAQHYADSSTQEGESTKSPEGNQEAPEPSTHGIELRATETLTTGDPFETLLPIDETVCERIAESIGKDGFDPAHPIVIWDEKDIVIDGHTRLEAATKANIANVYVVRRSFESQQAAIEYALFTQRGRRNLTDGHVLHLIEKLDVLFPKGGDIKSETTKSKASDAATGKSSERTAELIGISASKVDRARRVLKSGNAPLIEAVHSGDQTINAASKRVSKSKPAESADAASTQKSTKAQSAAQAGQQASKLLGEASTLVKPHWTSISAQVDTAKNALDTLVDKTKKEAKSTKKKAMSKKAETEKDNSIAAPIETEVAA